MTVCASTPVRPRRKSRPKGPHPTANMIYKAQSDLAPDGPRRADPAGGVRADFIAAAPPNPPLWTPGRGSRRGARLLTRPGHMYTGTAARWRSRRPSGAVVGESGNWLHFWRRQPAGGRAGGGELGGGRERIVFP